MLTSLFLPVLLLHKDIFTSFIINYVNLIFPAITRINHKELSLHGQTKCCFSCSVTICIMCQFMRHFKLAWDWLLGACIDVVVDIYGEFTKIFKVHKTVYIWGIERSDKRAVLDVTLSCHEILWNHSAPFSIVFCSIMLRYTIQSPRLYVQKTRLTHRLRALLNRRAVRRKDLILNSGRRLVLEILKDGHTRCRTLSKKTIGREVSIITLLQTDQASFWRFYRSMIFYRLQAKEKVCLSGGAFVQSSLKLDSWFNMSTLQLIIVKLWHILYFIRIVKVASFAFKLHHST